MNINTMNSEPLTSKTGRLAIALYPNTFRTAENEKAVSYYARVLNRSLLKQEDIADDIIANGSELPKGELLKLWKLINTAVTCRLVEGISVDTGLGTLRPSVTGSFESMNSEFEKSRHTITVQYRPGKQLAQQMSSLTPVIAQGNRIVPEITSVEDKRLSKDESGKLSSGGFFCIRGKNILVAGSEEDNGPEGSVGLYFDNLDDSSKSVRLTPDQIYHNQKSLLEGIIPNLPNGRYKVRVATRFSGGVLLRKNIQEHCFDKEFIVGEL